MLMNGERGSNGTVNMGTRSAAGGFSLHGMPSPCRLVLQINMSVLYNIVNVGVLREVLESRMGERAPSMNTEGC